MVSIVEKLAPVAKREGLKINRMMVFIDLLSLVLMSITEEAVAP